MGDRTTCYLTIPTSQLEKAKACSDWEKMEENYSTDGLTEFVIYDVNYGELDLADSLANMGIPCNYRWEAGGDYGPGSRYFWFTEDGESRTLDIADSEINPCIQKCMALINKPGELRQYLVNHHVRQQVPDLDDKQIEYGKKYLVRQLIDPS